MMLAPDARRHRPITPVITRRQVRAGFTALG
jgi:hypothetical protein